MPNAKIYKEHGKVLKIESPNESATISVVKRGNVWDIFIERHDVDGDEIEYIPMEKWLDRRLEKEYGEFAARVLSTLLASLVSNRGWRRAEDEEVYYAKAGDLSLYYFKNNDLVYVVDGETALNLGPPKDAVKYASDYLEGPKADIVRAFVHAVAGGQGVPKDHKKGKKKKTPA